MNSLRVFCLVSMCFAILSSCAGNTKVIGIGQNIHHDDFEYSVQAIEKTESIGSLHARGTFLIVTFQVENRARRVDHRWNNGIAYLLDEHGTKYDNNEQAQQELNRVKPFGSLGEHITPAGMTEKTMLVFELPKEIVRPYLRIRGSSLMGDVFDGNQFRSTNVQLF